MPTAATGGGRYIMYNAELAGPPPNLPRTQASPTSRGGGPDRITAPILGAIYRAVLGSADFSLDLIGTTGVFKTELASLAQRHFGVGFDPRHLPGSFASTGNSLESLSFSAKDALLVVDDFAPTGSSHDVARCHREADRILRAQGNRSGRGRLRPDGELRAVKAPRGLILLTGEDVSRGQSLRSRLLIVEMADGDVDVDRLSEAQHHAGAGLYAAAMAGYLQWLAPRYNRVRDNLPNDVLQLRQKATRSGQHRRTPDIVANIMAGLALFARFATEIGAVTDGERDALLVRCWNALGECAHRQAAHVRAADPARRFIELLASAIVAGEAHLADPAGHPPEDGGGAQRWGWRLRELSSGHSEWHPQGRKIGWIDANDLYLDSGASYRVAEIMAGSSNNIGVTEHTLRKRLREGGWLASVDDAREKLLIRKTLQGQRRHVLHLKADTLSGHTVPAPAQPAPDSGSEAKDADSGPIPGAGSPGLDGKPAHYGVARAVLGWMGRKGRVANHVRP